jgi:hypothetical protein
MKVGSALKGLIGIGTGNDALITRPCMWALRQSAEPYAANPSDPSATAGIGAPIGIFCAGVTTA